MDGCRNDDEIGEHSLSFNIKPQEPAGGLRMRLLPTDGDGQWEVTAGGIVSNPAGTPHGFMNIGASPLRLTDIHDHAALVWHRLDGEQPG
jgi:hypothetical protein